MSDWAKECADRWHESVGLTKICRSAIEGAVREALAKAALVVDEHVCAEDCQHLCCVEARESRDEIRALGAGHRFQSDGGDVCIKCQTICGGGVHEHVPEQKMSAVVCGRCRVVLRER